MARLLKRAVDAVCWSGQKPIASMRCSYNSSDSLVICKTHPNYDAQGHYRHYANALLGHVNTADYEPEKVLQGVHDTRCGPNTGHFTTDDPLSCINRIGSLFAYKVGTQPLKEIPRVPRKDGKGTCFAYWHRAYVDMDALNIKALHARTSAGDVFKDWPIEFTLHCGYTFWCIPGDVEDEQTYIKVKRPESEICRSHHTCKETLILDREKYIDVKMETKGLSREEAEKAADAVQFKVPVELDFSALGISNLLLFLPVEDARNREKILEEMGKPDRLGTRTRGNVDMSKMRLVPHPRFNYCPTTNWFKVVPKGERVSWEADGYWKGCSFYMID